MPFQGTLHECAEQLGTSPVTMITANFDALHYAHIIASQMAPRFMTEAADHLHRRIDACMDTATPMAVSTSMNPRQLLTVTFDGETLLMAFSSLYAVHANLDNIAVEHVNDNGDKCEDHGHDLIADIKAAYVSFHEYFVYRGLDIDALYRQRTHDLRTLMNRLNNDDDQTGR